MRTNPTTPLQGAFPQTLLLTCLLLNGLSYALPLTSSINPASPKCSKTQYYDTTSYICRDCPDNSLADDSGKTLYIEWVTMISNNRLWVRLQAGLHKWQLNKVLVL